jgi:hypothetical protein
LVKNGLISHARIPILYPEFSLSNECKVEQARVLDAREKKKGGNFTSFHSVSSSFGVGYLKLNANWEFN